MLDRRLIVGSLCLLLSPFAFGDSVTDMIQFGNEASEESHAFDAGKSEIVEGGLGVRARRLLPPGKPGWRGGRMTFEMKIDPDEVNYVTVKFWGSDTTGEHSRLMLFMDGKQIGQRHLGEVDALDIAEDTERFPNRFFYKTLPLPQQMTRGKTKTDIAIEGQGPVWGYGYTFEKFQQQMTKPSRTIYRAYVQQNPFFTPAEEEPQGRETVFPIRSTPGAEVIDAVKKRVNREIGKLMQSKKVASMEGIRFLAYASLTSWTDAYHQKKVLNKVVRGVDHYAIQFRDDPEWVQKEWVGAGPVADAVRVLGRSVGIYLDHPVDGTESTRRELWTRMLAASRDWHIQHRRAYTNQTMIVDLNIYRCNKALQHVNLPRAWPEDKVVRLLYEAVGLEPWSGSLDAQGKSTWRLGKRYLQLTERGLTKELGYVGGYGEIVLGLTKAMYDATRPTLDAEGDPRIKAQLAKMARARAVFRVPASDNDGFRAMRLESVIGWRDWHYPGNVLYVQSPNGDGGPLDVACATKDSALIGICQQMLEDNQVFVAIERVIEQRGFEALTTLLRVPDNYESLLQFPSSSARLPMSSDRRDFVYFDPEIGVVAVKRGNDILFASLYWRSRYAINFLARVHFLTPTIERDATVRIGTLFTPSGLTYTMPDQTNEPFNRRYEKPYQDAGMRLGAAGETQPIAKVPSYVKDFKPGKENYHAGKGEFYLMQYGNYCIAMNCNRTRKFTFPIPDGFDGSRNLVDNTTADSSQHSVKPLETVVLYRE
ncbi:hypothetical protein [Rhodopirellula sallentina]|uniref:Putative secreted protein n=1 Tax=Rhodopirellula sallentina SM41 TaxID=1263870 RepID=M5U4U4_9BACT|nr:hypothetical protein [Rhodopirellula sallentina]EMI52876.1 putative secreted protein [Rhodopirellula sallentina SM41]